MCLILFATNVHSEYPLVFAGNRDEFYDRPATAAHVWDEAPHVVGGRDREAGGTWLGVTRRGFWATVTNVRDPEPHRRDAPSRGHLVADYLKQEPAPESYLEAVAEEADRYNGFNLIVGRCSEAFYLSNRDGPPRSIPSGLHGMSNAQLNDSWPKVERGKRRLHSLLEKEVTPKSLFDILQDRRPAPDEELPETGVGRETERQLSSPFIVGESYGTRASTVILLNRSGTLTFIERTFDQGTAIETRRFNLEIEAPAFR